MTGSTINTYVTQTATLGFTDYPSPLTITTAGTINTKDSTGVYGAVTLSNPSLVNNGIITAAQNGVQINGAGAGISNTGAIQGTNFDGVDLGAGGAVTNTGTAATIAGGSLGVRVDNAAGTVSNTGTIQGGKAGVYLYASGYVNNQYLITGGDYGVAIYGRGTVVNTGAIYETTNANSTYYAVAIRGMAGFLTNSSGAALISGAKGGAFLETNLGVVVNDGTIESNTGAGAGVVMEVYSSSGTAILQNNGTAALISGYNGVLINTSYASITNAGTIEGLNSNGVRLAGGGAVSNTGTAANIYGFHTGVYAIYVPANVTNAGSIGSAYYSVYLGAGGTVTNTGSIGGGIVGVKLLGNTGTLINAGTVSASDAAVVFSASTSNELIVDVGAVFSGAVEASYSAGSTNTLDLAQGQTAGPGALFGIGNQFTGFGTIDFNASTAWTLGGNNAGLASGEVINGFTFGDTIDLTPSIQSLVARRLDSAALTETFANNTLTLFSGDVEFATLNLNELPTTNSENFEVFSDGNGGTDIVMDMPCFCTGTKILTPNGEVNVEDLQLGDIVITVRDNGPVTGRVTWTGRRSLDIARHPNPDAMHPVRITAGAFAPGLPERDLRVSPHHALYIDGALMEAISLVNGATVIQEFGTRFVTYHHFALETHDVILAEGLPAETYLETGHLSMFEGETTMVLHPNFRVAEDADACAPIIRTGAKLEAARAHLLARAEFLGFTKTDDIDLVAHPRHGRA